MTASASPSRPAGPTPGALVPLDPRDQALARLALSRQHLREALIEPLPAAAAPGESGGAATWRRLRRWAGRSPVLVAGMTAARGWWRAQPWRPVVESGARELQGQVVPLVRRHPVLSLLAATGLGAGLVMGRRWWWGWASAQVRPMRGHLAQWAMEQVGNPATQALLWSWLLSKAQPGRPDSPESPAFPSEGS